jgi:hypothetical protein
LIVHKSHNYDCQTKQDRKLPLHRLLEVRSKHRETLTFHILELKTRKSNQNMSDIENLELNLVSTIQKLAAARIQRKKAEDAFVRDISYWNDRQDALRRRLTNRQCGTHIFLDSFSRINIPGTVLFKQAKLCSYLYNIELNKFHTKLLTWQCRDTIRYFHQQMNYILEGSAIIQIEILNKVAELKCEMTQLASAPPLPIPVPPRPITASFQKDSFRCVVSEFESSLQEEKYESVELDDEKDALVLAQHRLWDSADLEMCLPRKLPGRKQQRLLLPVPEKATANWPKDYTISPPIVPAENQYQHTVKRLSNPAA